MDETYLFNFFNIQRDTELSRSGQVEFQKTVFVGSNNRLKNAKFSFVGKEVAVFKLHNCPLMSHLVMGARYDGML